MNIVEITCLAMRLRLPDLNLDLVKGDVVQVSEADARKSRDLASYLRLKGVSTRVVRLCGEEREMPVPPQKSRTPSPSPPPPPSVGDLLAAMEVRIMNRIAQLELRVGERLDALPAQKPGRAKKS